MSDKIKNADSVKYVDPAKLLEGLALTDKAINLNDEKSKLLRELRRTLARKAISLGLLDGRLKLDKPCPVCNHKVNMFGVNAMECRFCFYDSRGAAAIWERLHGKKS